MRRCAARLRGLSRKQSLENSGMHSAHRLDMDTYLPYMRDVIRCEQSLRELNLMWRMIEAAAKMNCPQEAKAILPTMAATREGFNRLEQDLVASLVNEKVATVLDELGTKARYVIDIVVRNLFERTADVGFLAIDRELCAFVAGLHSDQDAARLRLCAYASKYTVYDDIVLLDARGNVLVQIDDATPVEGSADALIRQTLASGTYVETFRASDLRPGKSRALIYSQRMLHPNTGAVVGVLCLCFNFEQEMAGIFQSHGDVAGRTNMMLLDADNRVIESSDSLWVPPGAKVPVNHTGQPELMMYAGREYLVRTMKSDSYQGYAGPTGWQGQVMMPVDVAFAGKGSSHLAALDPAIAEGLLSHAQTFSPPLYAIMSAAQTISRVVWNGQVMTTGQRGELMKLKTILDQIGETGARSNELFSKSIGALYETVLASSLRDAEFVSRLLVDLLERNLYERSNDCRWWALTPELRYALAAPYRDTQVLQRVHEILVYINQLYTVYTRLFVYDATGRIVSSTQADPHEPNVIGQTIDPALLARVLNCATEQDYCVSAFEANALYQGQPTYVFHAAIRHPQDQAQIVGGIGIVFDSEPQFVAMLGSALGNQPGTQALFVDRTGTVISSTDPTRPVGATLQINPNWLTLPNGSSASQILVHDGHYTIVGCAVSSGYREFKVSDGYRADVLAVVYESFGTVRQPNGKGNKAVVFADELNDAQGEEYATFLIDGMLFALPAASVLEALPATRMTSTPGAERKACVGLLGLQREGEADRSVWVFDLSKLVHDKPAQVDANSQIVIVREGGKTVGLLVDALHGVPQFSPAQKIANPFAGHKGDAVVTHFIKANAGQVLVHLVDVNNLMKALNGC